MFLVCAKGSGGHPQGVQGPRLADSKDPGLFGPVRGADLAKKRKLPTLLAVLGVWGEITGVLGESRGPGPSGPVRGGDRQKTDS